MFFCEDMFCYRARLQKRPISSLLQKRLMKEAMFFCEDIFWTHIRCFEKTCSINNIYSERILTLQNKYSENKYSEKQMYSQHIFSTHILNIFSEQTFWKYTFIELKIYSLKVTWLWGGILKKKKLQQNAIVPLQLQSISQVQVLKQSVLQS